MAERNPVPPEIKAFRKLIGSKITEVRKARNLSIEQLSEITRITVSTLANIEDGRWPVDTDILYHLKNALGFDIIFEMHD